MSLGQVNRGLNILGLGQGAATAARMARAPEPPPPPAPPEPKLGIAWGDFHQGFFSSVRAIFAWPLISGKFLGSQYFRDCWVERRVPKRAVLAAALWHAVFFLAPFSLLTATIRHNSTFDHTQLTWSGPIEDFPLLNITVAKPKPTPAPTPTPRADAPKAIAPRGADAFHPRQRIMTDPVHPNHPRQTLIHPAAPQLASQEPPPLPNMVQLQAAAPARPRMEISADALAKLHPRQQRRVAANPDAPPPDVTNLEQKPADLTLAASNSGPARPKLDLNAGAAPRLAERAQKGDSVAAPELSSAQAANGSPNALIALSASPAPPQPEVQPPAGNLAAKVALSPDAKKSGVPNGTAAETNASAVSAPAANNGAGKSDIAISISGGNPQPKSSVTSGLGVAATKLSLPSSRAGLNSRPETKADDPAEHNEAPNFSALPPGAKPEQVFAAKRVYTLAVNMANLNSASGSWILHFAEMGSASGAAFSNGAATPATPADLAMPVPVRKVDPKYPPDLIEQNVQGEVVLYGVIHADGTVGNIQVAHSLDPQLDANAQSAFAQWKFTPASKAGTPVDLQVIAHIPFKIRDDR